jgi:hypothetical protein
MPEKEEKSASIPWLPLITLIGVGSGAFLFLPQLISSRPGGGDPQLAGNTFDPKTINARLWQDPLGPAIADREKNENRGEIHSVMEFQKLLIKKCFAKSAIYPLDKAWLFEEQEKQVQILAVMIPGGPYVEDVERRLRSRRAVIEGLGMAGYAPEKDDEIGYFYVPWQPLEPDVSACVHTLEKTRLEDERFSPAPNSVIEATRNNQSGPNANGLLVPYEWCEPAVFGPQKKPVVHVLVLWLIDDAFRDAPLARLADLISWFRLKLFSGSQAWDYATLPVVTVLGPDNSGTLHKMVMEAKDDPWSNGTRQYLAKTHIYSSQAAVAESQLLSEIPATGEPRTPVKPDCKNLIEENVKRLQSDNGFCFDRTVLPDDQIVGTLLQELECRRLKKDDHVAIISEEDTYYARALCSTFREKASTTLPLKVHSYTYLRGIDGKLPSDGKDEKETKGAAESGDKNTQSSLQPTERTEGLNQADDIRRLAQELRALDTRLRRNSHDKDSLKAVGLLGSDVYDKLELLRALRPVLPGAVFFTNNLEARFSHPDEWNETHNLVVASAFPLSLEQDENVLPSENVPPFRDSGQTALFAATLEAMGQTLAGGAAKPKSPLIFEIGRNGPIKLSTPADHRVTITELSNSYLQPIGCFIAIGISLLAWTWFVSRVAPASLKSEIENQKQIRNEYPDSGKRVEAI